MKLKNIGRALLVFGAIFGFTIASGAYAADATVCKGCHGVAESEAPNISGLSAIYIAGSLKKFKEKKRPCDSGMCDMAAGLSDADMDDLGKQFSADKFVRVEQKFDAALAEKGKAIHEKNCEKCHSEGGSLASDDTSILAGQKMGYLRNQIDIFRAGLRPVNPRMAPKIKAISKDDIEAILNFYASAK